ncbi:MAG TPA: SufD family Fe-S cluster assembly protein [Sphingobium sp.]
MTALAPLPTRKDEAWRYSDIAAVARAWPIDEPDRFVIAPGEHAHRAILQDAAFGDVAIRDLIVEIGAGGSFALHLLDMGGALGRVTLDVTLHEGAHFELKAALLGSGEQTIELVTRVTHAEPHATSNQTVRAIAAGTATTSYLGQVRVARDAQKTDASQSFKAMILDRGASANAKPELEIFADDVKCAHGASIGELDAQALFYLASRGLDPATAKRLLLQAFIAGLFDDMVDEPERARFESAAVTKLGTMG